MRDREQDGLRPPQTSGRLTGSKSELLGVSHGMKLSAEASLWLAGGWILGTVNSAPCLQPGGLHALTAGSLTLCAKQTSVGKGLQPGEASRIPDLGLGFSPQTCVLKGVKRTGGQSRE